MKYDKAPFVFAATLTWTLAGCASLPQVDQQASIEHPAPTVTVDTQALWGEVIAELFPMRDQAQAAKVASLEGNQPMPMLIAGDWLAMQCAFVGAYWDMDQTNDAPTFAGAPESWFQLD